MVTRMKPARKHVQRLAGKRKARRGKAKKGSLRTGTVHSDMPLWGRPGYLLRRLHQIHYALFFEECAGFDITPVQYGLLTTLSLNPDLDQNSLARELGIDRTNVADVLNRLARRGLLERRRSPPGARGPPGAPPQPGRRPQGVCGVAPPRRATDAKDVLADATRPEASARAASRAGAQRAHHNADPPHQWQQSSWANDLSAQL